MNQNQIHQPQLQNLAQNFPLKFQQLFQNQPRKQILCSKGNPAIYSCLNQLCKNYAFKCADNKCECHKQHIKCLTVITDTIISTLLTKIISTKQLELKTCDRIQKSIQQLSSLIDNINIQLKEKFKFYGLNKDQHKLAKALHEGNVQNITGQIMWKAILKSVPQKYVDQITLKTEQKIQQLWNQFDQQLNKKSKSLMQQLQQLLSQSEYFLQSKHRNLVEDSKILKNHKEAFNLLGFFDQSKIKSIKLLYSAQQNAFEVSRFHVKCDGNSDTLTLCETQYGKIIGGYTPIQWNRVASGNYTTSNQKKSFIFSFTNKDKFTIGQNNKQYQIRCENSYGPAFGGGHDIYIANKANQNTSSYADIGYTYTNANYTYQNAQSNKKFTGARNFKIKQWEVWKIQFQK